MEYNGFCFRLCRGEIYIDNKSTYKFPPEPQLETLFRSPSLSHCNDHDHRSHHDTDTDNTNTDNTDNTENTENTDNTDNRINSPPEPQLETLFRSPSPRHCDDHDHFADHDHQSHNGHDDCNRH